MAIKPAGGTPQTASISKAPKQDIPIPKGVTKDQYIDILLAVRYKHSNVSPAERDKIAARVMADPKKREVYLKAHHQYSTGDNKMDYTRYAHNSVSHIEPGTLTGGSAIVSLPNGGF